MVNSGFYCLGKSAKIKTAVRGTDCNICFVSMYAREEFCCCCTVIGGIFCRENTTKNTTLGGIFQKVGY